MASESRSDLPLNSTQLPSALTASGCLKVAVMETAAPVGVVASRFMVTGQEVVGGEVKEACRVFEVDGSGRVLRVVVAPWVQVNVFRKFISKIKRVFS